MTDFAQYNDALDLEENPRGRWRCFVEGGFCTGGFGWG